MKNRLMVKMVSEKVENTLKDLGLTEYETQAYVGLVKAGPTTARKLSEKSGVPHSRIYDILSKLEKRGWIESQSERPARYRAKPPSEVLRLFRLKQEEKFKEISKTVEKELEPLYEKEGRVEKPEVWTIRGDTEIQSRIGEMITSAEREVLISLPSISEKYSELTEFLPLLKAKDLDLRILTSEENEIIKNIKDIPNVGIRHRDPLFGGGVIIDGKEALIVLESGGRIFGIWSDEIGLVKFAEEYFEYLWTESKNT